MTPPLVGDHPALDLMNTVAVVDGAVVDFWQSDGDVVDWLAGRGLLPSGVQMPQDLLAEARGLREVVRALVEHRKRGEPLALERSTNSCLAPPATRAWVRDPTSNGTSSTCLVQ